MSFSDTHTNGAQNGHANGNGVHSRLDTNVPSAFVSASTRLRRRLQEPGIIVGPGVYDGFSARIAQSVGFDTLYMTGAGTSASRLGQADLGLAGLAEMRSQAEMIANLNPSIPLIADMDTGYGNALQVNRAVSEYIRSGVAGFHIEDQTVSKRCGHLGGKQLVDKETFVTRVRAAYNARIALHSDIVIIARTDALQKNGYEDSISRLKAAKEAGADVAFLEGITSKEEARQAVKDLAPMPVLLNMVEHAVTPTISVQEAEEMGFKFIIWPFAGISPAYYAIKASYELLKETGRTGKSANLTPKQLFEIGGLTENMKIDAAAGGQDYVNGV
jgi:2-methylisocitrate lyase-like PEP mutase family enzyme